LAKQRRGPAPRSTKKKATARKGPAPRSTRPVGAAAKAKARRAVKQAAPPPKLRRAASPKPQPAPVAPTPAPAAASPSVPPRKPGFYEAVAIYERGVQALQRHDYHGAADLFRTVIDRYPEERELLERAHLYLRVCERETARQASPPQSSVDHVYAATVALNAGDHSGAMTHLQRALTADQDNDHAHYIMAATLSMRGRREEAIEHLRRSIALNPENRTQARQDPDLDNIRDHDAFRTTVESPGGSTRKPIAARRR
jgi:tetratricopeptide (TPR) repeat protein